MVEINWKQDYKGDFICPLCEKSKLRLAGFNLGIRQFACPSCKSKILASIKLRSRLRYLESRLKDEYIDWEKDYHGEFICPACGKEGISVRGIDTSKKKRQFWCSKCRKKHQESCSLEIERLEDPLNPGIYWFTGHRIEGFICPECQNENIYLYHLGLSKKRFQCHTCKKLHFDSIILTAGNLSHYSNNSRPVKPFQWSDDKWDLRAINPNFDEQHISGKIVVDFTHFKLGWLRDSIKQYVHHLSKINYSVGTIHRQLPDLKNFSHYLAKENLSGYHEINRSFILDYLAKEKKVTQQKLGALRNFFKTGTIKGWFNIDQDIIRDADYPKQHCGNPDPLSDVVRKQVEENLHLLPDPIARMWLIGYFAAMRPSELAFLKQDCLVQEGQYWKLAWHRKKGKDNHEIPISRTIAKIVQEQQEYIKNLWGDEWDYLFCHYRGLSMEETSQSNQLEPVKKVLPSGETNPLLISIRTLIKSLNIRDENNRLAKFHVRILRHTRLTELFEQGHDLAVVSAWAGHKHLATTSIYYTQVSCELMEREAGHIQKALVNSNGHRVLYESFPKSFWENPTAHKLELGDTHINTPIYGYCGLPLDQDCHKFRACYTCQSFVATIDKLPEYINVRDELRGKQTKAMSAGQEVLVEQFGTQADRLDEIIAGLHQEAA